MVGQGVLRECLLDDGVERVVTLGRTPTGQAHPKLRETVHDDLLHLTSVEDRLGDLDAGFYCLGASAAGSSEACGSMPSTGAPRSPSTMSSLARM